MFEQNAAGQDILVEADFAAKHSVNQTRMLQACTTVGFSDSPRNPENRRFCQTGSVELAGALGSLSTETNCAEEPFTFSPAASIRTDPA